MAAYLRAFSRMSSSASSCCFGRCKISSSSRYQLITSHPSAQFSPIHTAISPQRSPLESNILRILRTGIDYRSEYAPPHQPVTKFNAFTVEDRPGEQFVTLRRTFAEEEHIKIEVTMFDGSGFGPKSGNESSGKDVQPHISLLVDIWKGEGQELLEFLCSAWPDTLEIQNVYVFKHGGLPNKIYMGPNFGDLKDKLRNEFYEFLKKRGVTDDLAIFLHQYMMNKDSIELIRWLEKVELFIEK